jgi:hypothetical protein
MKSRISKTHYLRGTATLKKTSFGTWAVRIAYEENGRSVTKTLELGRKDVPENMMEGEFYVSLKSDGTRLYDLRPTDGVYIGMFSGFQRKKDPKGGMLPPEPRLDPGGERASKDGNGTWFAEPRKTATALFRITRGQFKGLEVSAFVPYIFVLDEETGMCLIEGRKGEVDQVNEFIQFTYGSDEIYIPFSANVLPDLEPMLQDVEQEIQLEVVNGIVRKFIPMADDDRPKVKAKVKAKVKKDKLEADDFKAKPVKATVVSRTPARR